MVLGFFLKYYQRKKGSKIRSAIQPEKDGEELINIWEEHAVEHDFTSKGTEPAHF